MDRVIIAGIGQTPVGEHWDQSLANLSARAILSALRDADGIRPQALYVGNMLSSVTSRQANLGTKLVENVGLGGIETFTVEAGEASGAAALRMGYLAVKSGFVENALVVGVEKFTDAVGGEVERAAAMSEDYDFEAVNGLTPAGQAGLLMVRCMQELQYPREAFAYLPLIAHAHAAANPNAMYRRAISLDDYLRAPQASPPLNLYDVAPYADGAAAILLVREDCLPDEFNRPLVTLDASSSAVDGLALHDRSDPLAFSAAALSAGKALVQAGLNWDAIDLFELWDASSVHGLLSIEALGLAPRGEAYRWIKERLDDAGSRPALLSMGGNKARGYPLGAAGVYQVVEAALQLRGNAGGCQLPGIQTALVQAMGGPAATVITHILSRQ